MALGWTINIDWDLNGVYTDEGGRCTQVSITRGCEDQIDSNGSGFEKVRSGEFTVKLDNYDGRYDPYNSSSPLYGYILPGRPIQIKAVDGSTYDTIYGEIKDIRPVSGTDEVVVTGYDALEFFRRQRTSVAATVQTSYSLATAMTGLISDAGYVGTPAIDDNLDTIPYFWTESGDVVSDAIFELAESVGGKFFIARNGIPTFYSRNHDWSSVLTFNQSHVLKTIQVQQPWDAVFNVIEVSAYPRRAIASTDLWRLNEVPQLDPGETRTFWAHYQYNGVSCPASVVTTPAATTDYTANDQSDGLGTDRTGSVSISISKYSSLAIVEVTNNHTAAVYLTLLKIRGTVLSAQDTVSFQVEDSSSIAVFRRRGFRLRTNRWIQLSSHAEDYANYLKLILPTVKRSPWVIFQGRSSYQFGVDLYDLVTFSSSKLGIPSSEFLVGYINHEWRAGGSCVTKIRLEPHVSQFATFWIFTAQLGTNTYFGW